jgi:predicted nucleic acid-binding protein
LIVLDTTVLIYAKGEDHPMRTSCAALIEAIAGGTVQATTTPGVIQEFVHVRARRRDRRDAAALGRAFADLLSPLITIGEEDLVAGLRLFERHPRLGAFEAVLAAATIACGAEALISADRTFSEVRAVNHVLPGTRAFNHLIGN